MSTHAERLKARTARLPTPLLIATYLHAGRAFDADPTGPDASTYEVLLSVLDFELLARNIPCCPTCSAPTTTGWHSTVLHADSPTADQVTDLLIGALAHLPTTA